MTDLQSACAAPDHERVRALVHSLKGASLSICAEPTCRAALALEEAVANDATPVADGILEQLRTRLSQLEAFAATLDRA